MKSFLLFDYNSCDSDTTMRRMMGVFSSLHFHFASAKKSSKNDKVLAKHYGFTEEELDFIINYDIKYRMGDELNEE